jgi:hypothetical protein
MGSLRRRLEGMRPRAVWETYRFVTLWVSAFRTDGLNLLTSAMVGAPGAEFCVSSIEKSMFRYEVLAMAASGELENAGGWMRDKGW